MIPTTLSTLDSFLTIDTETTGVRYVAGDKPFAVSCCDHTGQPYYWEFPVNFRTRLPHYDTRTVQQIRDLIFSYKTLVFHNSLFDIEMLGVGLGINLAIPWLADKIQIHDTLTLSHCLDSAESHGLKDLGIKYLDELDLDQSQLKEEVNRARDFLRRHYSLETPNSPEADYWLPSALANEGHTQFSNQSLQEYAITDAIRTAKLFIVFINAIHEEKVVQAYDRERMVLLETFFLQRRGATLRPRNLKTNIQKLTTICQESETNAVNLSKTHYSIPNLNIRSTKQLPDLLFSPEKMGLRPTKFTNKGNPSTDAESLSNLLEQAQGIDREILESILRYRRHNKGLDYLNSYYQLQIEDTIFSRFNPSGTRYTRFSSSDPNLQQVGKRDEELCLRQVFGPKRGKFVWFALDYNQLELRIVAEASKDPTLMDAFRNDKDVHQITADSLGIPRSGGPQSGKHINFAYVYGATDKKLSSMAGIDASFFSRQMKMTYPGLVRYMQTTIEHVKRFGNVRTLFGYRIEIDQYREYTGVNGIVQGTAGDIMKNAMILVGHYLRAQGLIERLLYPIINVHDELVFEVSLSLSKKEIDQHISNVKFLMEYAGYLIGIRTPVDCEIAKTDWGHLKPYHPKTQIKEPPPEIPSSLYEFLSGDCSTPFSPRKEGVQKRAHRKPKRPTRKESTPRSKGQDFRKAHSR